MTIRVVKATLAESAEHAKQAASVKTAQELLTVQTAAVQPLAEKMLAYSRHVYEIASEAQAELGKVAEWQAATHSQRMQAFVDAVSKSAPVGSESVVALVRSAITAANTAYDSVQQATRHATELAEQSFHAASKATAQAAAQTRKTATVA